MGYLKNPSPWERGKLNSRNSRRFIRDRRRDSFSSFSALWEGRKEWICRFICKSQRRYCLVNSAFPETFCHKQGQGGRIGILKCDEAPKTSLQWEQERSISERRRFYTQHPRPCSSRRLWFSSQARLGGCVKSENSWSASGEAGQLGSYRKKSPEGCHWPPC